MLSEQSRPNPSFVDLPGVDVLVLDNRDSFTFNIAQAFAELGSSVAVVDADETSGAALLGLHHSRGAPKLVVVGPGPRGPRDLPRLVELVRELDGRLPLFGICLGLQVLVQARGGQVGRACAPMHGKVRRIRHTGEGCFVGLPDPLPVMRYHSLVATRVPESLRITAVDDDQQAMAVRDPVALVEAVQFHPESIGTAGGLEILRNVAQRAGIVVAPIRVRPGNVPPPSSIDDPLLRHSSWRPTP